MATSTGQDAIASSSLEAMDIQFAPFLDEIVIDTNELESATTSRANTEVAWPTNNVGGSKHILHEMSIVRSRIGFDEQVFRDKCQQVQSELCQEFKDAMVAEYSKSMYQIQMENLRDFEKQLSEIRRASLQAGLIDQMSCLFRSDH